MEKASEDFGDYLKEAPTGTYWYQIGEAALDLRDIDAEIIVIGQRGDEFSVTVRVDPSRARPFMAWQERQVGRDVVVLVGSHVYDADVIWLRRDLATIEIKGIARRWDADLISEAIGTEGDIDAAERRLRARIEYERSKR